MDRFRSMETFVRVARSGSFTIAADQLGLSRALVSRYVGSLEARLGVRLIQRTTRSLHLTDEGRSYLEFCENLFQQMEGQERAIRHARNELSGTLRIAAPKSFGTLHLSDAIVAFACEQPRLRVQLVLENVTFQAAEFGERGIDLALRFTPARNATLVEQPIAAFDWVVCASPALLAQVGRPTTPSDLASRPCLLHMNALQNDRIWRFEGPRGPVTVKVSGSFSANSALALRKAALAGLGIGLMPRYSVADDLASGDLVVLLQRYRVPARPLTAVYPRAGEVPHKVRIFLEFLSQWLNARDVDLASRSCSAA